MHLLALSCYSLDLAHALEWWRGAVHTGSGARQGKEDTQQEMRSLIQEEGVKPVKPAAAEEAGDM